MFEVELPLPQEEFSGLPELLSCDPLLQRLERLERRVHVLESHRSASSEEDNDDEEDALRSLRQRYEACENVHEKRRSSRSRSRDSRRTRNKRSERSERQSYRSGHSQKSGQSPRRKAPETTPRDVFVAKWCTQDRCQFFLMKRGCRYAQERCPRIHCDKSRERIAKEVESFLCNEDQNYFSTLLSVHANHRCLARCQEVLQRLEKLRESEIKQK